MQPSRLDPWTDLWSCARPSHCLCRSLRSIICGTYFSATGPSSTATLLLPYFKYLRALIPRFYKQWVLQWPLDRVVDRDVRLVHVHIIDAISHMSVRPSHSKSSKQYISTLRTSFCSFCQSFTTTSTRYRDCGTCTAERAQLHIYQLHSSSVRASSSWHARTHLVYRLYIWSKLDDRAS